MPAINPYHNSLANYPTAVEWKYAPDSLIVAPGADAREVKFLASRALYSSQADSALVLAPVEEQSQQIDEQAQQSAVLDQWALETAFRER
ncbi:MAG TPA: hypothetical protein VF690_00855, partial [Hymenobacter sp.]